MLNNSSHCIWITPATVPQRLDHMDSFSYFSVLDNSCSNISNLQQLIKFSDGEILPSIWLVIQTTYLWYWLTYPYLSDEKILPSIWLITQRTYPWCKITPTTLYQRLDFNGSSSHFSVLNDSGLTISRLMQFIIQWWFCYFVTLLILWYFDTLILCWYFDTLMTLSSVLILCWNLKSVSWVFCLTLVLLKFDSWG